MPYKVEFAASVEAHLRVLTARDRATAITAIQRQVVSRTVEGDAEPETTAAQSYRAVGAASPSTPSVLRGRW